MTSTKKKRNTTSPSRTIRNRVFRKPRKAKKTRLLKDGSIPEAVIQAQILSWLESTGQLAWRQNSGKIPVHGRMVNLGPDGISDIVVLVPPGGRFLALEVKSAKGTLRPVQRTFKARLEAVGGIYMVVRSLQEAMRAVAVTVGGAHSAGGDSLWKELQLGHSGVKVQNQSVSALN